VSDGRPDVGQLNETRARKASGRHKKGPPELRGARHHLSTHDEIRPEST